MIHMPNSTGGPRGYKYIPCMVDMATRWVEAFPLISATAKTITKILTDHIIPRYGEGLVFVTDQGREFTNKMVIDAIEASGGKHYATTSYHSQSNPVERFNRTLEEIMRVKLIDKGWDKSMWPKCLPEVLYTMRCSPDTLLGNVSPFRRVFTREPYTRITTWFGNPYQSPTNQELIQLNPDEEIATGNPEDEIIEETADSLTVARKEQVQVGSSSKAPPKTHVCTYEKIPAENGRTHFLQEVACIQLLPEIERVIEESHDALDLSQQIRQRANDVDMENTHRAAARRHDDNAHTYNQKRPVYYVPIPDELVDVTLPHDVNNPDNRKMKDIWFGPYRVVSVAPHGKTCVVEQLVVPSLNPARKTPRRIAVDSVKPCTSYRMNQRPRGEDYKPPWVEVQNRPGRSIENQDEEFVDILGLDDEEKSGPKMRMTLRKTHPTSTKVSTDPN